MSRHGWIPTTCRYVIYLVVQDVSIKFECSISYLVGMLYLLCVLSDKKIEFTYRYIPSKGCKCLISLRLLNVETNYDIPKGSESLLFAFTYL